MRGLDPAMALHRTLQDHVQQPPAGAKFGVRTRKIHIPTDNVRDIEGLKRDENAWVGLTVAMRELPPKGQRGPSWGRELARATHRALPEAAQDARELARVRAARQRARKAGLEFDATAPRPPRQSISNHGAVDAQELLFAVVQNWLPAHMLSQTMWKRFPTKTFSDGEPVQARFRGRATFYDAYIARARDDGTYDLAYADGENEYNVKPEFIRALSEEQLAAVRAREAAKREQAANRRNKVKKKEAMERAAAKAAAKAAASGAAKATGGADGKKGKGGAAKTPEMAERERLRRAQVNNSRLHKSASDGDTLVISRRKVVAFSDAEVHR